MLTALDPSWHWLLLRGALFMLWSNANAGVMCPVSMTYAAVPALRDGAPALAAEWEPRLTRPDYSGGALAGMAMTERQGAVARTRGKKVHPVVGLAATRGPFDLRQAKRSTDAGAGRHRWTF